MKYSNEEIQNMLLDTFSFLIKENDMTLITNRINSNGIKQIYKGKKTGVTILFEFREAYVNVLLHRLTNHEINADVHPANRQIPLNNIGLDYIVKYRNESDLTKPLYDPTSEYYGKDDAFKIMIAKLADNLRKYGAEILTGNFNTFSEVDGYVKDHYK